VQGAGSVLRAADQLRRGSASAATELLGLGLRDPESSAARLEQRIVESATPTETRELARQGVTGDVAGADTPRFRSPYLFEGTSIVMLDQREPPERGATVECHEASEVATAIAAGVIGGGPVLAQVAAYGLVLAAAASVDRLRPARRAAFQAAANTLRGARPAARAVAWGVERMATRWQASIDLEPADALGALREEADAIATDSATDHALLGRHGADLLQQPPDRPLSLLAHGDMGPLAGGLVGTGFAVVQSIASAGREVHVWLTEATPDGEGRRIAAAELAQADIPHTVIPDTAVAWLLAEHPIDAALLRPDHACANGDTAAIVGSHNVARLANAAAIPVYACGPMLIIDTALADGRGIPRSRSRPELDVVPGALITAYITEQGALQLPLEPS